MKKTIPIFCFALLAVGCGKFRSPVEHQDYSHISFDLGHSQSGIHAETIYPLYGKILIYIRGSGGTDFASVVAYDPADASDSADISLPNGTYTFYALGWEGNDTPACTPGSTCNSVEGQTKCGIANSGAAVTLTGGDVSIPIVFSSAACNFGAASDYTTATNAGTGGNFPIIRITFGGGSPYTSGGTYVQIGANIYTEKGGVKTITSTKKMSCVFNNAGTADTANRIPVGLTTSDGFLSFTISVYSDSSCSTAPLDQYVFSNGFINGTSVTSTVVYSSGKNTITLQ